MRARTPHTIFSAEYVIQDGLLVEIRLVLLQKYPIVLQHDSPPYFLIRRPQGIHMSHKLSNLLWEKVPQIFCLLDAGHELFVMSFRRFLPVRIPLAVSDRKNNRVLQALKFTHFGCPAIGGIES